MLAVINLNQLAKSPQAAPVHLFNMSEEAGELLSQFVQDNALDTLATIEVPSFNSGNNSQEILLTIAAELRVELDKYKALPGRAIKCVFRVHNDCKLVLEVWHSASK